LTFYKWLKTSDFISFALIISSDELQSKAQFNVGTGYRAEKTDIFPQMKTSRKVHICLHLIFYLLDNVLQYKAMLIRYQLFYDLHVMLLLVNVMFSCEHSYFAMACRALVT